MHREKRSRSAIKAITYRIISIIIDSVIAYTITKDAKQTIILVLISNSVSILVYFLHERAWNRIHWGKHAIQIDTDRAS
jgi:uncharacterized membrane protein